MKLCHICNLIKNTMVRNKSFTKLRESLTCYFNRLHIAIDSNDNYVWKFIEQRRMG